MSNNLTGQPFATPIVLLGPSFSKGLPFERQGTCCMLLSARVQGHCRPHGLR